MRFRIKTAKVGDEDNFWWEEYSENIDDPEKWSRNLVDNFNNTLRPHEKPRIILGVDILSTEKEKHTWVKHVAGMSVVFRKHIVDIMYCSVCSITGKRYNLESKVQIDSKFKKKCYQKCNTSLKEQEKLRQ